MLDIDAIILAAAKIFSLSDSFSLANTPAQISEYATNGSTLLADAKILASQIALTLSIVFAAIIAYVMIQRRALVQPSADPSIHQIESPTVIAEPTSGALRARWNEVLGHLDSNRENDWKTAIMEADKLVDTALKKAGFPGDAFGDRLTNIQPGTLTSLDGLWWAHRIRNRVAHEMDYFLRYTEARQAMSYYEATLVELQMI